MEYITEWARQIAGYLIFSSVCVNLIRKQIYLKYVKLVLGIILIVLIAKPLFSVMLRSGDYEFHLSRYLSVSDAADEMFINQISGMQEGMLLSKLETEVEERIRRMAESDGLEVREITMSFCAAPAEYGKLDKICLSLCSTESNLRDFGMDPPKIIRLRERIVEEFACDKKNVSITLYE